jgi:hypothetical protein
LEVGREDFFFIWMINEIGPGMFAEAGAAVQTVIES